MTGMGGLLSRGDSVPLVQFFNVDHTVYRHFGARPKREPPCYRVHSVLR